MFRRLILAQLALGFGVWGAWGHAPSGASEPVLRAALPARTAPAAPAAPAGMALTPEVEPNDVYTDAVSLPGTSAVALGHILPADDVDYYAFTGSAGDRVYAAVMTAFSGETFDSQLTLLASDGTTVLEADDDDGTFGGQASSLGGVTLPGSGTFYLRLETVGGSLHPYHLHLRVHSGSPASESEPNNDFASAQPLPGSGWVAGALDSAGDVDTYAISLPAGATLFASLDLDPERDGSLNGWLEAGPFGGVMLSANSADSEPRAQALFVTVSAPGTYYLKVAGSSAGTYHLSATVRPAQSSAGCATYTSTTEATILPGAPHVVDSTLVVPDNPRIGDLDVTVLLTHTELADLDVILRAPAGNENALFTDLDSGGAITLSVTFDDEAAIPPGPYALTQGVVLQPEGGSGGSRLDWFDGQAAGGAWTLRLHDDSAGNGGRLLGWSLRICPPPPAPVCPPGTLPTAVFSADFEANDGGFARSAAADDEWEHGTPGSGGAPITTCASGTRCWVTDLDGQYSDDAVHALRSPVISLADYAAPLWVTWSQKYQIESAAFDTARVTAALGGGGQTQTLWEWLGPTMNVGVGSPEQSLHESAGWGTFTGDLSAYAGQLVQLHFTLATDASNAFSGLAIDDVNVYACQEGYLIHLPFITRE